MFRYSLFLLAFAVPTYAADYDCNVERKVEAEATYTERQIQKGQFSVKVENRGSTALLSRCSFSPIVSKVTCDVYEADKVVLDSNVKIKKYYVFQSQLDVQIFPDLSFVENNGRGGIAYGKCRLVAP